MNPDTQDTSTDESQDPGQPRTTAGAGSDVEQLRGEIERIGLEKQQLFERLARAQAEFQNSRRRLEQDQEQAMQYANQSLLKNMLPLMDNLERALAVDPTKVEAASILQGVQLVRDQFEAMLRAQRVETVAPKPGDPFDPSRHEALLQQPSNIPAGHVVMLLNKGYSLMGRTLRPAQVAVSKEA